MSEKLVESFKDSFPLVVEAPVVTIEQPVVKDPILRSLRNGLTKISKPGAWIKGAFRRRVKSPEGEQIWGFCMVGSISGGEKQKREAMSYLSQAIYGRNALCQSIPAFNDNPRTSLRDVQRKFEKAIELRERDLRK